MGKISVLQEVFDCVQTYLSFITGNITKHFIVTLEVDYRCNARCSFCNRWHQNDLKLLSTGEIFQLLDDIRRAGGSIIALCGGEPLLRKDIFEIIRYAKERGFRVNMNTNGMLIPALAEKIAVSGLDNIMVSIDRPDTANHDEMRGVKGTFENAVRGIRILKELNCPTHISISTTIFSKNLSELKKMIDLAHELGVNITFQPVHDEALNNLCLRDKELGLTEYSEREIEDKILEMIEYYHSTIGNMGDAYRIYYQMISIFWKKPEKLLAVKCTSAARTRYFVNPEGYVFPCESRRDLLFGNVRERKFSDIIYSPEMRKFRKEIIQKRPCVCWWKCQAMDMVAYQFAPLPKIRLLFPKLWNRKIRKLKLKSES